MKKPASATVFGILNILIGGLSILGTLFSLVVMRLGGSEGNPVLEMVEGNSVYTSWVWLTSILGLIAAVVLVASGIGLLNMKPWARIAAVGYSYFSIVMVLVGTGVSWVYVYSPLLDKIKSIQDSTQQGVLVGSLIGGLVGIIFGLAFPGALLYFMTRPGLVAAFEGTSPEPSSSRQAPAPFIAARPPLHDASNPYSPPRTPLQTASEAASTGDEVLATVIPFRNKPALISYYLGLFSLAAVIPILGVVGVGMAIAAFVLGLKGRRLARDRPEAKGTAHAWVGILGGAFWGVLGIAVQVLMVVSVIWR